MNILWAFNKRQNLYISVFQEENISKTKIKKKKKHWQKFTVGFSLQFTANSVIYAKHLRNA